MTDIRLIQNKKHSLIHCTVDLDHDASPGYCYVAGPMTGRPGYNYEAFDNARDVLVGEGWYVINPADLDRINLGIDFSVMTGHEDLSEYVTSFARQDITALLLAHAVFLLPGWRTSTGATNEARIAKMLGVPLYEFETREQVDIEARFAGAGVK